MNISQIKILSPGQILDFEKTTFPSPLGQIQIEGTKQGVGKIFWTEKESPTFQGPPFLQIFAEQIQEYFEGKRKNFSLPLVLSGTPFQIQVWKELIQIPYGKTATYGEIAQRIGCPKGARAVGQSNNKNEIPLVIPCHRVIGKGGKLTGYESGLWRKEWLLQHETKFSS